MSERTRRDVLSWMAVATTAGGLLGCGGGSSSTGGADAAGGARLDGGRDDAGRADAGRDPDADLADAAPPDRGAADAASDTGAADAARADAAPPATCDPTRPDAQGPFFQAGAPARTQLAADDEPGDALEISGVVRGPDCAPLAGALLDVWQADVNGDYHDAGADYRLRGQVVTDAEGRYAFRSIVPGRYPLGGSTRPAHVHFMVSHPGHRPVTTQMYFAGDPFLAPDDPCTAGCDSGDPARIVELTDRAGVMTGTFDITLGA